MDEKEKTFLNVLTHEQLLTPGGESTSNKCNLFQKFIYSTEETAVEID